MLHGLIFQVEAYDGEKQLDLGPGDRHDADESAGLQDIVFPVEVDDLEVLFPEDQVVVHVEMDECGGRPVKAEIVHYTGVAFPWWRHDPLEAELAQGEFKGPGIISVHEEIEVGFPIQPLLKTYRALPVTVEHLAVVQEGEEISAELKHDESVCSVRQGLLPCTVPLLIGHPGGQVVNGIPAGPVTEQVFHVFR